MGPVVGCATVDIPAFTNDGARESRGMQSLCGDIPELELYADKEIPAHIRK